MTITRFAPSPTGLLHLGNLRTALFNWALARKAGGTFLLRLDDTDPERSRPEFAEAIRADLAWLGLAWDREETQSARLDRYEAAAEALKASGRLYPCWETPEELDRRRKIQRTQGRPPVYDRAALRLTEAEKAELAAQRAPHWRFKLSHERIEWVDGILGEQSIDAASVSDPVLIRADGQVLYTLASAVDDSEMGVTDVVRGADHVTNTAAQIQIIRALGAEPPRFAHHSLLTGPGGEALSKRLGALSLQDLRGQGIEPAAILSLLSRLGSADPVEPRRDLAEIAAGFDLSRFGAAPVKLDPADLGPLTARILHETPFADAAPRLAALGIEGPDAAPFWAAVQGNLGTLAEAAEWWDIAQNGAAPDVDHDDADYVALALSRLPDRPWGPETWKDWTGALKAETGRKGKALFMPLRRALTGRRAGPDMAAFLPLMRGPLPPRGPHG
ncbi:glutamate--tRNA ligase [Rhodovulum sp. DZ06]|uniref:glutamate--tRNA ligase n=1 Tax=Rhodovulum sp. DZ06 TaxID=3425126 RepID=UPI003D342EC7